MGGIDGENKTSQCDQLLQPVIFYAQLLHAHRDKEAIVIWMQNPQAYN